MALICSKRMESRLNKLQQLYSQLFPNETETFSNFCRILEKYSTNRKASLQMRDMNMLSDLDANGESDVIDISLCVEDLEPAAFHCVVEGILHTANEGSSVICLDSECDDCATIVQMIRLACEIVCPSVQILSNEYLDVFSEL